MGFLSSSTAHLRHHADLAGATASSVCLVHCLLSPLAISLFPNLIPYLPGDTQFHRMLAVGIVLCGALACIPGYREHRRKLLLILIVAGIALILAVASNGEGMNRGQELLLSISGSAMLITAHLLNRSFCHQCRVCSDHEGACHTTGVQ